MRIHIRVVNLRWRFWASIAFVCAALGVIGPQNPAADACAAEMRITQDATTVSIFDGDRSILRYRFADVAMKPYADQLHSPAGVQILRDQVADHKHHHALMYALSVDGVNFWEELARCGTQRHKSFSDVKTLMRDGTGRAGFVEMLDWIGPDGKTPMLVERRAIDVLKSPDLDATLVHWRCRLETPPGKESVKLSGDHYYGLGMRFLQSMDTGGRLFNADDKPGEVVRGTERLTPVKWCAYTAKADGRQVTVTLFDHPDNLRHPAKMFTMTVPFAYLSATFNEWKEPVTLSAGKPLEFSFGIALWDGEASKATVEKVYRRWLKLSSGIRNRTAVSCENDSFHSS